MADTPTTALTAATVRRAERYLIDRADTARAGADGDWRNPDVRAAFLRAIGGISVHMERPGVVIATASDTPTGKVWHYVARDALRAAAPDGGEVVAGGTTAYRLTFNP